MPGSKREVKNAKDEGVRFLFNRQPLAIEGDTAATGVRVVETRAAASGSRSVGPEVVDGSEAVIAADIVILAFGFRPDPADWLIDEAGEHLSDRRLVVGQSGRLPFQTAQPKLFAGGDVVRGADLVVTAVADGRDAAASIVRFLGVVSPSP
jgi:glutamate synthase (NADPH/NADH) small chain